MVGAIENGGIYVKLGQGLACFNHILPREYTETLPVLQDKVQREEFSKILLGISTQKSSILSLLYSILLINLLLFF